MKKLILFSLGMVVAVQLFSQYPSAGLLRATGTFAVGKSTWLTGIKPYFYSEFEVMPDDHVGVAGTILTQLAFRPFDGTNFLEDHVATTHHLFFGPTWHFFPDQPLDLNVALQPGFTLVTDKYQFTEVLRGGSDVAPSVSGAVTLAYYGSFFHVFAQARMITGKVSGEWVRADLTEGLVTFGLGFNLDVKK